MLNTTSTPKPGESTWLWLVKIFTGPLIIVILTVHFLVNHSIQGLLSHSDVIEYYRNFLIVPIMEGLFLIVVVSHSLIGTRSIILDLNPKPGVLRLLDGFLIVLGTGAVVYGIWLIFKIMSFGISG